MFHARFHEESRGKDPIRASFGRGQLGMRTSFLTQIAGGKNRVVAAHNEPGGSGVVAGTILPLAHTY